MEHGRAACQHDVGVQLLEVSWIPLASLSMKRISADLLVHADHDAWHLGPADSRREKKVMPDFFPRRPNVVEHRDEYDSSFEITRSQECLNFSHDLDRCVA